MLLAGLNIDLLEGDQLINVIYSLLISDISNMEVSRVEARETLDKRLHDAAVTYDLRRGIKPEPEPFVLSPAVMANLGIKMPKPAGGQ